MSAAEPDTLAGWADAVLRTSDADAKAALSRRAAVAWRRARGLDDADEPAIAPDPARSAMPIGRAEPPDRPARPPRPELLEPKAMPKRGRGGAAGRVALLHAIAHIELNAVDLHWDVIARFADTPMPMGFYDDWVAAADDEAKHFQLLTGRLAALNSSYGALPAHAGMWRAAEDTAQDLMGRLAVVPMVLEARGLDVTPGMIAVFNEANDPDTAAALEVIYAEEVAHVAYGSKWFHFLCGRRGLDPKPSFHRLVREYFKPPLRPPFNEEKRAEAGLPPDFYWPLAIDVDGNVES